MGDESKNDDESVVPPEVTVPPWLRTGPTPESPMAGAAAPGRSDGADGPADETRADPRAAEPRRAVPPNRITLGARRRAEQTSAGPSETPPAGPPAVADEPTAATHPGPADRPAPAARVDADRFSGPPRAAARPISAESGRREPDQMSRLPLGVSSSSSNQEAPAEGAAAPTAEPNRRPLRIALLAGAGVAVLGGSAVLGYVVARGAASPDAGASAGCVEVVEPGRVSGSGPGSLDTPAGTVLAFDHAYYAERSAEKAFEAVSPSSRMTEEQLRVEGVEKVAEGTGHCVEISELSPTLLEVELTEYPPEADPVLIRQRVRVEENPDGTWGIVSITPAG